MTTMEPKRMKSDQVRTNWADVLQHVRTGGTVVVEHYSKPVATIAPYEEKPVTTYTARVFTAAVSVPGDHCVVMVHANTYFGDDEAGEPIYAPSDRISGRPIETTVRVDDKDKLNKIEAEADRVLAENGWHVTDPWQREGTILDALVERADPDPTTPPRRRP
jgi:antitoxin (DNA-binding transcriptional repressor) of toxin-antitoxin stability system